MPMKLDDLITKKLCVIFVKYSPIIQSLMLLMYVLMCYLGIRNRWIEFLFSCSLFSYFRLISASIALDFCRLHRYFITYNAVVYVFITIYNIYGDSMFLKVMRLLMLFIGILLFTSLYIKLNKNGNL